MSFEDVVVAAAAAEALFNADMPPEGQWQYVPSSNVVAFKYERSGFTGGGNTLTVRFKTPSEYEYLNVPDDVIRRFADTSSPGAFVNAELKNRYSFTKVA